MAPADDNNRWIEVTPSQFSHEIEGLDLVRQLLPRQSPFRAWSNFEFRDGHGRWHEVDLLVLGRGQFHLVELKYYSGRLRGDDHRWVRDGHRAEDSPLKLARRKAQYFASKIRDEFRTWALERRVAVPDPRAVIPYVQESVFLHHPRFRCELSEASARGLYGIDGMADQTNLPGISDLLLGAPRPGQQITPSREKILVELMRRIGLVQRREREAGSWVIEDQPLAEGEGWQEWQASYKVVPERRGRIRFQVAAPGAPEGERRRLRRIADHEFTVMDKLAHDGLLRPTDIVESELGVGLVYPYDKDAQRLDLWLAEQTRGVSLATQLSIIRQAGEALQYAHGNKVVHRGLIPRAVWIRQRRDGTVKVQVGGWQSSGAANAEGTTGAVEGVTSLFGVPDTTMSHSDGAPRGDELQGDDRWLRDAFAAPEGAMGRAVDRIRVDVFGLGALAFYLLTGQPPARSAAALRDRLREQSGLDLSPELPQVSETLRTAVLQATRPAVSERTADVSTFLAQLSESERRPAEEQVTDPLEATRGTILAGRFQLEHRLGTGSTALGLLVNDDLSAKQPAERVLKVAIDDNAARRLSDEAEVLAGLKSPRLVKLVEGPITVGGRQALLLHSAGRETLATALRQRGRLSLDLQDRFGTDLLEALVALDAAGVDHRDIKPSNLGVAESRSDRSKHLVLFDFSLSRAAASALGAGTPPYLDPFLTGSRDRYDSAAERYAAAVVLFEMATGATPVYGDGLSDPASITDEATIEADRFDRTVAHPMITFFQRALARDVSRRQDTAAEMLGEWKSIFAQTNTTIPDNADELAQAAEVGTPLAEAGLSARALSALEPLHLQTVGDLVAVDAVRLGRLSGVAEHTRREVKSNASKWRKRFGKEVRRRGGPVWSRRETSLPGPFDVAELLLAGARQGRGRNRPALVQQVLGLSDPVEAFATQAQLAASLPGPVTAAWVNQLLADLQAAWAADQTTRNLLVELGAEVTGRLAELGGVATVDELTDHLLSTMVADPESDDMEQGRLVQGLLRLVVDRQRLLIRAEEEGVELSLRRREGRVRLLASDPALLDLAEALGRDADRLVADANGPGEHDAVVPAIRVAEALTRVGDSVPEAPANLQEPVRLARLAAAMSTRAAASAAHELHHRGLSAPRAIALTLTAVGAEQLLPPAEIRDRVRVRFPALAPLPERPGLDAVVQASGLGLVFDARERAYRSQVRTRDTTGLESRPVTVVIHDAAPVSAKGVIGQRLSDSLARRSFLALGTPAVSLQKLVTVLEVDYDARVINLTAVLLQSMRQQAAAVGLPWTKALSADAQPKGSRDGQGLAVLVGRALPAIDAAIDAALGDDSGGPVVLTDAAPLARYEAMNRLSRWTDLATPRPRALWLVVPQLHANQGPLIDGRPLPLAAPGQFVSLSAGWVDTRHSAAIVDHAEGSTA